MRSLKVVAFAGAAALMTSSAALAADMPPIMHPPAPIVEEFGGWYLRGDIGMTNQSVRRLDNVLFATTTVTDLGKGFDSSPFFGIGIGYKYNSWLRFDVTGEYRAKSTFRGLDRYVDAALPTGFGVNDYYGSKHEWVALANVCFDLGTWYGVTPFVGAGVGVSHNVISNFRDVNMATGGVAFGDSAGTWNLAWAVHAGLAYRVSNAFTVELAYRYINLGHARSGDLVTFDGTNTVFNPMHFRNIDSHDVKLGVRWNFDAPAPYLPPLMTKG